MLCVLMLYYVLLAYSIDLEIADITHHDASQSITLNATLTGTDDIYDGGYPVITWKRQ